MKTAAALALALSLSASPAVAAGGEIASYTGLEPGVFLKKWLVLGAIPLSNGESSPEETAQKKFFESDSLAAAGGETTVRAKVGENIKAGDAEHRWKFAESKDDVIDLTAHFGRKEFAVAYAYAEIEMAESASVLMGIGSDDGVKVWLNGTLVHDNWVGRPVEKDSDLVQMELLKGTNRLLLKVQNGRADWGFVCRRLAPQNLADKLVAASASGDLDKIKLLLTRGVNVNTTNKHGFTALNAARTHGYSNAVELLLAKGADPKTPAPSLDRWLDAVFREVVKGVAPGAAVLVAKDGKILLQKGYGYASLEHRVPITPETKFRIGSITKQFTAAAILRLQEQGKLSVQDRLSKFIPDYPRGDEVTLHHLLTHTSGIHSYTSKPDFFETVTVPVKPEELIKSFRNDPYDFSPGEKWSYNNSGYFLLGYIIEKISGMSYGDFLKKEFFEPLAMNDTGVHNSTEILEHEATGYSYEVGKMKKALNWDMSRAGGAGALYSTVGDLYRWNEALFNGRVLNEVSLKAAFTPAKTKSDGKTGDDSEEGYGYGWSVGKMRALQEIAHGGGLQGFLSYLLRVPNEKFTVVVLANAAAPPPGLNPTDRARELAALELWEKMGWRAAPETNAAVPSKAYDALVGRYDYGGAMLEVTKEGDRLFAQLTGQPKFEIFPKSETEFFWKIVDAQVTFVKNEQGETVKALHRQGGMKIEAPKLKDEPAIRLDPDVLKAYVGKYDYGKGTVVMTVTQEGPRLFAQVSGQPKFEIFPKSETEFFWKVVAAQITFVKDGQGKVIKGIHKQGGQTIEAPKIE